MNISDLLKNKDKVIKVLEKAIDKENKEVAETLIPIVKDPRLTYKYARDIVKSKIKDEWEDIIIQDADVTYWYVRDVIRDPFPKGEDIMSKDAIVGFYYAENILRDRFIKGEKTIIKSIWLDNYVNFLKEIGKLDEFLKDHPEVKDKV